MADMTATTMATYLPEQWSKLATITYRSNVILPDLMDRRWEPEIGVGMGDTVNIPSFSQNTGATKRSTFGTGAAITFDAVTEAQVQLLIDQMAYKAFRIPVEMSVQAMAIYLPLLTQGVGEAVALQIDSDLAGDNTNGLDALTAIGTDNVPITSDVVTEGEVNLENNNAPLQERFFAVSPQTKADLLAIEVFRNQLYQATIGNLPGDRGPGFQGKVLTLEVHQTNNLEAGANGKKCAIWQRECIAYAMQKSLTVVQNLNITDGIYNQYAGYAVYGFKLVKSIFGREVGAR